MAKEMTIIEKKQKLILDKWTEVFPKMTEKELDRALMVPYTLGFIADRTRITTPPAGNDKALGA